jgi:cobaltochelatase CobN
VLDRLKDEGYTVSGYPRTRHEFIRLITKKNVVNMGDWTSVARAKENSFKVPAHQYEEWFSETPESCRKEMKDVWGEPPGTIMADEENFYVPGLTFGNVFVGFQPVRGYHEDPTKTYHDTALPPHHQYLAFYRWLQHSFGAHALIHFGTHGTLEFLPGKHVALSQTCYPDLLIGDLPNLYLYTCSNPSEAVIAKRRSYATTVDYMIPPMMISDLYGTYAEMEAEINSYYQQKRQSPVRAKAIEEKLLEMAKEANLIDIEAEDLDVNKLYHSLNEMKGSMMTKGVHVLGRPLSGDELTDFIFGIVRFDRGEMVSLHRSLAAAYGIDWDTARQNPSHVGKDGKVMGVVCEEINEKARAILADVLEKGTPLKKAVKKNLKAKPKPEDMKHLEKTLDFAANVKAQLEDNHEIETLVKALKAEFISPGLGGDPFRSPKVLPTARNIYQFNPDLVPTPLACERGVVIAEQVLENYRKESDGNYPETVGVVLWGFETMKTQGETVAEIFHLLGVRPKRSGIGDMAGVEAIPLEELGRPRLDVLTEICGIFRDTFPVLLRHIDRAFRLVVSLDEPEEMNFVRKHAFAIQKILEEKGVPKDKAEALSKARIFGPSASNYGTDVTNLIETSEWEEEDDIANLHIHKMGHVYGDAFHAVASQDTFKEVLGTVDVVAQVRDNEEYGITDLDHYYEFLGGLSKSAESVRKVKPSQKKGQPLILVADSTRDVIKTQDLKSTVNQEVRSKLLNPQWIKGQTDSGYRGVKNLSNRVEYLLGWQATAGTVDTWVWSEVADKYIFDEETRRKMMEENIWAVEDQLKRLMEAYQRGMWEATDEEIDRLKRIYLELESEIEEREE